MFRILVTIFRLNIKEYIYIHTHIHIYIYIAGCWWVLSPIRKETSPEACQGRARFQQNRDQSCHQVSFPARQGAEGNSRHSDRNISFFVHIHSFMFSLKMASKSRYIYIYIYILFYVQTEEGFQQPKHIYIYTVLYSDWRRFLRAETYIYIHSFMFSLKMASKSQNMSL